MAEPGSDDEVTGQDATEHEPAPVVQQPEPPRARPSAPAKGALFQSWLEAQKAPPQPEVVVEPPPAAPPPAPEPAPAHVQRAAPPPVRPAQQPTKPAPSAKADNIDRVARAVAARRAQALAAEYRAANPPAGVQKVEYEAETEPRRRSSMLRVVRKFSGRGLWGAVVAVGVASPAVQSESMTYYDAEHRFVMQVPAGWSSTREMRFGRSGVRFAGPRALDDAANCHVGIHPAAQLGELTQQEIEQRVATVDTTGFWNTTLEERAWSPVELEFFGTMPIGGEQLLHYSISKFTTKLAERGVVPVKFRLGFVYTPGLIYSVSCMATADSPEHTTTAIENIFSTFKITGAATPPGVPAG